MLEELLNLIFMDGNGLFVWFCYGFLILIMSVNLLYAKMKKRNINKHFSQ